MLVFKTPKKRQAGIYRAVPVPPALFDALDLVHGIRQLQARRGKGRGIRRWPWSRMTGWRAVHAVMEAAGLSGPQASPKGLRHSFGVAAVSAGVPLNLVQKWLGHAQLTTTAICAEAGDHRALGNPSRSASASHPIFPEQENDLMSQDLFAVVVAVLVFLSGIGGLVYQAWDPKNEGVNETRDLINRLTGLVATMSALVLGLLIASANNFYNSQKTGLETVSARVLALDGVLRRYGPDAKPARDTLKELITGSYTHVWQGDKGTLTTPTVEQAEERMDR